MAKSYLSGYIGHCMSFYIRYRDPVFNTKTDELNWNACNNALSKLSDRKRDLVFELYKDTSRENVIRLAAENHMSESDMWKLFTTVEKLVAKERGLI
jgi:hypothetical protein|nr:MAG TPA: hypothetical protein [Herelleviridae sp.]